MRQVSECAFAILDYIFFFFFGQVNDCNEMDWLLLTAGQSTRDKKDELRASNSMHE